MFDPYATNRTSLPGWICYHVVNRGNARREPALRKTDIPIKSISAEMPSATTCSYGQARGSIIHSGRAITTFEYKIHRPDDNLGKDKSPPDKPNIVG